MSTHDLIGEGEEMKRPGLLLSAAALLSGVVLLGAAGCGGGGSSGGASGGSTPASTPHQNGGTIKMALAGGIDYLDPALAYYQISWQIEYSTCLKLLNYPDKTGAAGSELVPDAATAMPSVSSDGLTYTFTVKSGYKFSPPSTEEVTPQTFQYAIERDLNPKQSSFAVPFLGDLKGASDYNAGKAKSVSGIKITGDQIAFTLTQPDPGFLSKIAMPFFCAIPTDTKIDSHGVNGIPSAGPYYVASYTPNRSIVVKKNPNYAGSRPAIADEFDYTQLSIDPNQATLSVDNGSLDYSPDGVAPAQTRTLYQKYGPNGTNGPQRIFFDPCLCVRYMGLNTSRDAFSNPMVRQAVNWAIDRPGILQTMGYKAGVPNDKIMPPGVPGADVEKNIYPLDSPTADDIAKAKSLIQQSGVTTPINAVLYTCNQQPCPDRTSVMQANLKAIGINVQIKQFERATQFTKESTKTEPFDIADEGWIADYPDPFDWVNVLLNGEHIPATNGSNYAYFNNPDFNKQMDDAAKLSGQERFTTYGNIATAIMQQQAPWAAWDVDNNIDFFSPRIGCTVYNPVYGMALNTMCVKS
jgi:ABC-type oligopeptide transport system substrate-binding subunit